MDSKRCEALVAALCISSVSLYDTATAVGLAMAVAAGALVGYFVSRITGSDRGICAALLAASTSFAVTDVLSAVMSHSGLEKGVFSACAVAVSLVLSVTPGGTSDNERETFLNTVTKLGIYALAAVYAGGVAELLGAGTLFGMSVPFAGDGYIGILYSPAGRMTLCALVSAGVKYIIHDVSRCTDERKC